MYSLAVLAYECLSGVLPYLKRMEHYVHGDPQFRGRDGPMYITRYRDRDPEVHRSGGSVAARAHPFSLSRWP